MFQNPHHDNPDPNPIDAQLARQWTLVLVETALIMMLLPIAVFRSAVNLTQGIQILPNSLAFGLAGFGGVLLARALHACLITVYAAWKQAGWQPGLVGYFRLVLPRKTLAFPLEDPRLVRNLLHGAALNALALATTFMTGV